MNHYQSLFILFLGFALSACGAPILNAQETATNAAPSSSLSSESSGENLLKAYGCPNKFSDIDLCVRIEWFDDQGKPTSGPMYWPKYKEHAMSAKLSFWSSKDGWPVDPRKEFPDAKIQFINLKLFMPHMGHGTMGYNPVTKEIEKRVGQFNVSNIHFVMSCSESNPWDVRIQLKTEHEDEDFDSSEPVEHEPHVWKQSVLQYTSIQRP